MSNIVIASGVATIAALDSALQAADVESASAVYEIDLAFALQRPDLAPLLRTEAKKLGL